MGFAVSPKHMGRTVRRHHSLVNTVPLCSRRYRYCEVHLLMDGVRKARSRRGYVETLTGRAARARAAGAVLLARSKTARGGQGRRLCHRQTESSADRGAESDDHGAVSERADRLDLHGLPIRYAEREAGEHPRGREMPRAQRTVFVIWNVPAPGTTVGRVNLQKGPDKAKPLGSVIVRSAARAPDLRATRRRGAGVQAAADAPDRANLRPGSAGLAVARDRWTTWRMAERGAARRGYMLKAKHVRPLARSRVLVRKTARARRRSSARRASWRLLPSRSRRSTQRGAARRSYMSRRSRCGRWRGPGCWCGRPIGPGAVSARAALRRRLPRRASRWCTRVPLAEPGSTTREGLNNPS